MSYLYRCYSKDQIEQAYEIVRSALKQWSEIINVEVTIDSLDTYTEAYVQNATRLGRSTVFLEANDDGWCCFYKKLVGIDCVEFCPERYPDQFYVVERSIAHLSSLFVSSEGNLAGVSDADCYASGWLSCVAKHDGGSFAIMLSPACFHFYGVSSQDIVPEFSSPLDLVTDRLVSLKIELEGASITLGELDRLSAGDVITLEHASTEPAILKTQTGKTLFRAELGLANGQSALKLVN